MGQWIQEQGRMLKAVRIIKAFYEAKLEAPIELLTEAPVPQMPEDMPFSGVITSYGMWGFRASKPINKQVKTEIEEMCSSLLGGLEALEDQRTHLERMQTHLERALGGEIPSNVITMRRRPAITMAEGSRRSKRYFIKLDCLIEGPQVDEIHKMAMELHSQGSRIAFVNYNELDINQRQSISQLLSLGAITLFIPDVFELSKYDQEILRHVMLQDTQKRPLLMVGSTVSYSDLHNDPRIDGNFLTLLSRAYIKLTRPFSEYKEQGLIHYFLDSLSESPT